SRRPATPSAACAAAHAEWCSCVAAASAAMAATRMRLHDQHVEFVGEAVAATRGVQGPRAAAAWAEGQGMTLEQAVASALDGRLAADGTPASVGRAIPGGDDEGIRW